MSRKHFLGRTNRLKVFTDFLRSPARIRPRPRGCHEDKGREKGHPFEIDFIFVLRCSIKVTRLQRLKLKSRLFGLAQILQNKANPQAALEEPGRHAIKWRT
jgi:hypothetical protein